MKTVILSFVITLSMLLTGCWDLVEPEELGLVTLIGMDTTDNGQIRVVIHEMSQQKQSSSPQMQSAGGSAPIKLHEATDTTISGAIQKISASDFRRTYFPHINAVILSEELVRSKGITPVIDYFERNSEIRSTAWLLIAKEGQFDSIFSVSTSVEPGVSTGKLIEGIIKNRPAIFFSANSLIKFLDLFWETGSEPYTSGISLIEIPAGIVKQESGAESVESNKYDLIIENMAVFKKDKMVGWMDNEESTGLLWATDNIKLGDLKIKLNGKNVVLRILKADSTIKPVISDERIVINVNVTVESYIIESQANIDYEQNEIIIKVQDLLSERIKEQITAGFNKSKSLNSDVFGFGNYVFGKYPGYWKKIGANWYDYYRDIDLNAKIDSKVNHIGLSRKTREGK